MCVRMSEAFRAPFAARGRGGAIYYIYIIGPYICIIVPHICVRVDVEGVRGSPHRVKERTNVCVQMWEAFEAPPAKGVGAACVCISGQAFLANPTGVQRARLCMCVKREACVCLVVERAFLAPPGMGEDVCVCIYVERRS